MKIILLYINIMSLQDWTPMILNKTSKNTPGSNNKATGQIDRKFQKLDQSTEPEKKELLHRDICLQLTAGRNAKKLSQKQLGNALNIDWHIIQQIEQFRYKKDMVLAQKIARYLGCKLTK